MAQAGWVDIMHPVTGARSEVLESALPVWLGAGWTRTDTGSEDQGQPQLQLEDPSTETAGGESGEEHEE